MVIRIKYFKYIFKYINRCDTNINFLDVRKFHLSFYDFFENTEIAMRYRTKYSCEEILFHNFLFIPLSSA